MDRCFPSGSVPIEVVAKILHKRSKWVREGIVAGWLPIGVATRNGKRLTDVSQMDSKYGRVSYYISPKLLYDYCGYFWEGNDV